MVARFFWPLLIAAPLFAVMGCGSSTGSGVKIGNAIWSASEADQTPGIDEGSASDVTLKADAEIRFVVWTDLPGWSGSGGGSPPSYQAQHSAKGRKLVVHAVPSGQSATVTIAGTKYNSASGAVFLVSTQNDPPTVAQIDLDPTQLPTDSHEFAEFARNQDAIRKFFQAQKK